MDGFKGLSMGGHELIIPLPLPDGKYFQEKIKIHYPKYFDTSYQKEVLQSQERWQESP